jgi:hypothetical protein
LDGKSLQLGLSKKASAISLNVAYGHALTVPFLTKLISEDSKKDPGSSSRISTALTESSDEQPVIEADRIPINKIIGIFLDILII